MYTLIEDFEDDARNVPNAAFDNSVRDGDDEPSILPAEMSVADDEIPQQSDLAEEGLDVESWSDDPVRMYLTQMGEIPLLTRKEEISLAKRIEDTRQRFRAKLLECNYVVQTAFKVLQRVHNGELPFDRTVQVSVTDRLEKDQILGRLPHNLSTLDVVLKKNQRDYLNAVNKKIPRARRRQAWNQHGLLGL